MMAWEVASVAVDMLNTPYSPRALWEADSSAEQPQPPWAPAL